MGLDIQLMRAQLRAELGVDRSDLPDQTDISDPNNEKIGADTLLNESWWEILDKYPFREKEVSATFSTVAAIAYYQIPAPFEALRQLSIEDLNTKQHKPLDRATIYTHEKEFVNTTDKQGKPEFYVREANGIRLLPVPDDIYTITIKYWIPLSDLSDTNATPGLPQSWHELVKYGALWRGFIHFGDHQKAQSIKSLQAAMIASAVPTEAKEEFDSHLAGVEVPGRTGAL